jgi:hypothetical protein
MQKKKIIEVRGQGYWKWWGIRDGEIQQVDLFVLKLEDLT